MSTYSVAEAKSRLSELIERAMGGEPVVITRHGRPVVELKAVAQQGRPMTAAEALLGLGEGRRSIVVRAMAAAEAGDVDGATEVIMRRVRAEEQIIDRILGLAPGGVDLAGSAGVIRAMLEVWSRPSGGDYAGRS